MSKRARTDDALPSSVLHGQFACHNGAHLPSDRKAALRATAVALAAPGKGITACDESAGTIGTRLEAVGVANTEENRRVYRQMLFEAPGAAQYLSGAILDPETLTQTSTTSNQPFPKVLEGLGIVPGTKPHLKTYTLPGTGGDTVMQGLDSLAARLAQYYAQGARFTKWRAPLEIDVANGRPTRLAIEVWRPLPHEAPSVLLLLLLATASFTTRFHLSHPRGDAMPPFAAAPLCRPTCATWRVSR